MEFNPSKCNVIRYTTKANKTLNFLRRNLRTCSAKSKERAYKALVRPIVEYSATVWDPYVAKNIQKVEMIERRAARLATTDYTVSLICYLLSNGDLRSSGDLYHVSVCCSNRVMGLPLTNATNFRENIRTQ